MNPEPTANGPVNEGNDRCTQEGHGQGPLRRCVVEVNQKETAPRLWEIPFRQRVCCIQPSKGLVNLVPEAARLYPEY